MGNLTAANYETEEGFRNAIRETRKLTDRPFMVGITILPSVRITAGHHQMYLRICAEEKVSGIEVSGDPVNKAVGPEYIDMLKKAGVKLFHKVGSVRHALHAQKAGYDGIYAAGIEEGGHPLDDDVTTMVLTPRIAGERMKQAWDDGDVDVAPMMVGQSIGLIQDVPTCKELLERMVKEAEETLERVSKLF
jgi:nitronate monooxygenase